jgi:nicotinate-nucleotide--dimethylbenzimidazole phosphoribosyltransferase
MTEERDAGDVTGAMQRHLDGLTKPRGSLGKLEEFCLKMARIQGRVPPVIRKKGVYVFAGDHGIASEGVSLYPQEVSRQMAANMFAGGAGINALSQGTHWELTVVDAGLIGDEFPPDTEQTARCRLLRKRVMKGSRNFYHENAMTAGETGAALEQGKTLAEDAAAQGYDLVAIGDLGIGNTSTAAAMMVAAGFSPEAVVDRGTGIDDATLDHKRRVIRESWEKRAPAKTGTAILQALGSPDFAEMAGLILGLEHRGIACVLDGFPVASAAYIAYLINPRVVDWLFAGHRSKVAGHACILDALGLEPIVTLDMHLGEGSGAVIGGHIIDLAVKTAREMASFAAAQVSDTDKAETAY